VADEWAKGPGDEIYANSKHQRYAETQREIQQEQEFKQQIAFGVAREWSGENKDKILKTFDTEEQKQKYLETRPDIAAAQEEYKSGPPTWGDRFKQDLPSNKYDRFREWEGRVHGGHEGSEYASRRQEFERSEREKSFMKRSEEAHEAKTVGSPQYTQEPELGKYSKELVKRLGLEEKPTTPFSQAEEQAMLEAKKQRVETLKTEQKQLETEHKDIRKQYAAPGANTGALDNMDLALREERDRLKKQQKDLEKQIADSQKTQVAQKAETEREERAKKAREEVAKFRAKRKKKEGEA